LGKNTGVQNAALINCVQNASDCHRDEVIVTKLTARTQ